MNMKQKITYMLIGCIFTLSGYVLSTLTNTPTQAQDDKVIDEIVCKRLKIVNDEGTTVAELESVLGDGDLILYNEDGKKLVGIGGMVGGKQGIISTYNSKEKRVASIGSVNGKSGGMLIYNEDGKRVVDIGSSSDGIVGGMLIYNEDGKELVAITATEGRRNDGIINIYNHKGEWRSYKGD